MNFHLLVDHIGTVPVKIYVTLSGNPDGIPVIYLHGGPGDHSGKGVNDMFNLSKYHVVQFDQRGCGRSTPLNHVRKNTTKLLIGDIEAIRKHLNVDKFVVAGGSWGTTLALAYAIKHPALGLILRGVYDLSPGPDTVVDYMYPELADKIKTLTRGKSIAKIMRSKSRKQYMSLTNDPHPMYVTTKPHNDSEKTKKTLMIVGNHYEKNHFFLTKKWIYANLKRIKCPVIIVQGRYDLVTPPVMAYNICKKLNCSLHLLDGGHTYHDLVKGLINASNKMAKIILR